MSTTKVHHTKTKQHISDTFRMASGRAILASTVNELHTMCLSNPIENVCNQNISHTQLFGFLMTVWHSSSSDGLLMKVL